MTKALTIYNFISTYLVTSKKKMFGHPEEKFFNINQTFQLFAYPNGVNVLITPTVTDQQAYSRRALAMPSYCSTIELHSQPTGFTFVDF